MNDRAWELLREGTDLLRQGKVREALPLLEEAHEIDKVQPDVALNLGSAYILAGKFSKAVPILEALRAREPANAMVWTNLGAAYLGNPVLATDEQQRAAIDAFKRALEIDPVAPSVAYNIGLIYRDRGEREKAIQWFGRALESNPRDQHARHVLRRLIDEEE
jgi:tetratricopeptide (TPR) repeat protein